MPIGLDLFLQQAGAIADTQQFHVVDDHMEQGTGLHRRGVGAQHEAVGRPVDRRAVRKRVARGR